jgi:Holliday junction resolvasome RuvABC DNA-binding subunit
VLDAYAKVFSALQNLGFREREVRWVLDTLRLETASAGLGLDALLREALQRLTPQRHTPQRHTPRSHR